MANSGRKALPMFEETLVLAQEEPVRASGERRLLHVEARVREPDLVAPTRSVGARGVAVHQQ
jgi:hypothetical protein